MSDTRTKIKHPGRVAQGHKLVALNRERKAAQQSEQQPAQQSEQQPAQQSQTSTVVYGGLAIVVVIGVALYVYRKKPAPPPSNNDRPAALQERDIFLM